MKLILFLFSFRRESFAPRLFALGLTVLLSACGGGGFSIDYFNNDVEAVFNTEGMNESGQSLAVIQKIVDEIDSVSEEGGYIYFTTYIFDDVAGLDGGRKLSDALIEAANNGVEVEVIVDAVRNSDPDKNQYVLTDLEEDSNATGSIDIYECPNGSCASSDTRGGDSLQHNKFMLIGYKDDPGYLRGKVLQTSSNFSYYKEGGSKTYFQDLLVIENAEIYSEYYDRYMFLKDIIEDDGIPNDASYRENTEISINGAEYDVHFFPIDKTDYLGLLSEDVSYDDVDPVAKLLNSVIEKKNDNNIISCNIRVASLWWSGSSRVTNLTNKINELLENEVCNIHFLLNSPDDKNSKLSSDVAVNYAKIHSKTMLISIVEKAIVKGVDEEDIDIHDHSQYVLTGSQNFTGPALYRNDETLLVIKNDTDIYHDYLNNWKEIYCNIAGGVGLLETGTVSFSDYNSNAATFNGDTEYANGEWVELINNNQECISMAAGHSMEDQNENVSSNFKDILLLPNEKLRILSGSEADYLPAVKTEGEAEIDNMTTIVHADFGKAVWNNTGDTFHLKNASGEVVLEQDLE